MRKRIIRAVIAAAVAIGAAVGIADAAGAIDPRGGPVSTPGSSFQSSLDGIIWE